MAVNPETTSPQNAKQVFRSGDLVWAKIKDQPGYPIWPPWPGFISAGDEFKPRDIHRNPNSQTEELIVFFGDHSYAFVERENIVPYSSKKARKKCKACLKMSIAEANGYKDGKITIDEKKLKEKRELLEKQQRKNAKEKEAEKSKQKGNRKKQVALKKKSIVKKRKVLRYATKANYPKRDKQIGSRVMLSCGLFPPASALLDYADYVDMTDVKV
eukprot:176697_1